MYGIFFYNQALPLIVTANLIWWIPNLHVRYDTKKYILVEYAKEFNYEPEKNENEHLIANWRLATFDVAHLMPILMLILEFSINRIRIPWHHLLYTIIFTLVYFMITFAG